MNKTNPTNHRRSFSVSDDSGGNKLARYSKKRRGGIELLLGVALIALLSTSAQAQFLRIKQPQVRVTVPLNTSLSTVVTGLVTRAGVDVNGITLGVSGAPAGATAVISPTTITSNNAPYTITLGTTNILQGLYTLSVNANGLDTNAVVMTNFYLFQLHAGHIWNGTTNAANDGAGNWSDSAQWLGGGLAGNDEVVFNDLGGQTNTLYTIPNVVTNIPLVNNIVDNDTTVASIRFAQTNGVTGNQILQIASGKKLIVTGANGFSIQRDFISDSTFQNLGSTANLMLVGTNASLIVSNVSANFALLTDNSGNNARSTLDMSRLDNLSAKVNKFALGDVAAWPNYDNIYNNGTAPWPPRSFLDNVLLAKTNVIVATFFDPNNYTNSDDRNYSMSYLNTLSQGSTTQPTFSLGLSNAFLMDSVCLLHANQQANMTYIAGFTNGYALFRSTNGGRMSVFTTGDGGTKNLGRSNIKGLLDFGNQGATLDMLVDRFYMSRDRKLITDGQTANFQTFMTIGKGTIDANRMILGFQEQSGKTNSVTFLGYCQALLMVSNTATVKVNGSLTLGYCVDTNVLAVPQGNYGRLLMGPGGTVMVSNIDCGGIAKLSTNTIAATNGASLIVSNSIGGPDAGLTLLSYVDGFLTLHLDLNRTTPYVYATNLLTSGSNVIRIATIKNLGSLSGNIQLVQFSAGAGSFQGLIMPPGLGGALITTNNVGIYLSILTNSPKDLIWRGYSSQDWDLTTKNWLDRATGIHTNFSNGDRLTFDDDGSTPTTVHLVGPIDLVPGNIGMSNNVNHYTIDSGGGDIQGSATLAEWGTAGVQIDGSTTLTVQVNTGTLSGSGSIGSAVVAAGATMNFAGSFANGAAVAGTATFSGNGAGVLSIAGTGIVTNSASGTYSGQFSTAAGSLLVNNGTWQSGGNSIVVSNATMINNGNYHGLKLNIGGKLIDTGVGTIFVNGDLTGTPGLTIENGGVFLPGGDGIGNSTVSFDASPNSVPGRVLLSAGSTNIFKVDPGTQTSTKLYENVLGLGPNQNAQSVNGSTIVMSNVTATPFAAGQSFTLFQYLFGGGPHNAGTNTANSYPLISPQAPSPGLVWDLRNITNTGAISIHSVATTPIPPSFSFGITNGFVITNITSTSTNSTTNNYGIVHLTWPSNYEGWSLQEQVSANNIGLSTNWSTIFGSFWTNEIWLTNVMTTNCHFYRMMLPQ